MKTNINLFRVLLFSITNCVFCQVKSTHNLKEFFFSGTIGNNEASFYLLKGVRPIYENGCFKRNLTYLEGNYHYNKNADDLIFLFSKDSGIEDFENDTLEIEETYNKKITGIFRGVIRNSSFKGYWKKPNSNEKLFFNLKQKDPLQGISAMRLLAPNCDLEAKISFNESEYGQSEYKIIYRSENSDYYYFLLEITSPYCRIYNCRGMNCGSSDKFICWIKLNKNCTDLSVQKYRISNADNFEDVSLSSTKRIQYFDLYLDGKIIEASYDSNKPEKGIVLSK